MYEEYTAFAIELGKEAGAFLRPNAGKAGGQTIKAAKDFVTEMDIKVEALIIERIQQKYPEHRIFSEEAGVIEADSDYEWVIDPIDGTINYSIGVPQYGVSIALTYKGEPIVGVIDLPGLDETYWASKGGGAFKDGEPIRVRNVPLAESFVSHSDFAKDGSKEANVQRLDLLSKIVNDVYRVRIIGTAAVTLAYIAAGKWDAALYMNPAFYDIAAGQLLVTEAGGVMAAAGPYTMFGQKQAADKLVSLLEEAK
ncbi:inositol monophosphatase family protein [Domibacillus sp. DTU_2020_1001157_1_SI_ALB_TIR_016]|uniref:inositol monophosphatase family protein n=1 Tax=Domibacillus sp. DTU_2020_1001157_1_SI_ALB_TIR_016 TaxID=3077789 RepID=UPI0028E6AC01|nr:inositol monophosphatase family protein [Domibacillus sp. DTU_2020_1001157_1_SI_ALB_TIR_016]WNS80489.1 inositol monophosphatase family protein [Domibacillus sp. DTU_2020_1001157_1_SI_ALB_TIR_016]